MSDDPFAEAESALTKLHEDVQSSTSAPAQPAAPASNTIDISAINALIDEWHGESFHGTRLGNDTEIWNLVFAAKEELKKRLAASL